MDESFLRNLGVLFEPLIGQIVWHVRWGHGTFLTMEFGEPHLRVREPIIASPGSSERVTRNLARRRVFLEGDWHLWVQLAHWEIRTANNVATSGDHKLSQTAPAMEELEGQKLKAVAEGVAPNSCTFDFDLGGQLSIVPSITPQPGADPNSEDGRLDEWSLFQRERPIGALNTWGKMTTDFPPAID